MKAYNLRPEGWNNEITKLEKENIEKYIQENRTLQGLVKECDNKYNLHINFENGLKGIIPRQEIEEVNLQNDGLPKESLCTGKVHKFVQFKIKQEQDENTLILSRKEVQKEALEWIKNDLKVGQKVEGIVKSIKPYGAFIEVGGGIVGLIHIEDLSVARIKTPYERVRIGQKLQVVVKSINRDQGKVILSYKETLRNMGRKRKKILSRNKSKRNNKRNRKKQKRNIHRINPKLSWNGRIRRGSKIWTNC